MLEFLRKKATDRKLRLFAVASVRQLALKDERIAQIVNTSESYADNATKWNELSSARKAARRLVKEAMQARGHIGFGAGAVWWVEATAHPSAWTAAQRVATLGKADLLRELFGTLPFRPISPNPSLTPWSAAVVNLAQAIYDERAFDRFPLLADALEESGCTNPDILAHCRGRGPHVRGCWVVDAVLGKE
jgi:hypothetical protein